MATNAEVLNQVRLGGFSRVATTRVDDAADAIGRIFCPHDLKPVGRSDAEFYALHNCSAFDGFSISYVAYGGSVSIDPGCLDRFFLLQIPLTGSASVRTASREIETVPAQTASLLSPTIPTEMIWHDSCAKLILLLDRKLVEQRAAALAGTSVRPIEFDPEVLLTRSLGRRLQAQIEQLVASTESLGPKRGLPAIAAAEWRDLCLNALLDGQHHSLSSAIEVFEGRAETQPAALRRARAYLEARAAQPLNMGELSDAAGSGIRALQIGFRRHFGTTISDMLLDIRLAQLNTRLRTARSDERIVDIAFDLGFTHLSRMASAYRAKFGESPKTTFRRLS
jgi:AraC-like DNA-binding protein